MTRSSPIFYVADIYEDIYSSLQGWRVEGSTVRKRRMDLPQLQKYMTCFLLFLNCQTTLSRGPSEWGCVLLLITLTLLSLWSVLFLLALGSCIKDLWRSLSMVDMLSQQGAHRTKSHKGDVLFSQGCHNNVPETEWLKLQKFILSQF